MFVGMRQMQERRKKEMILNCESDWKWFVEREEFHWLSDNFGLEVVENYHSWNVEKCSLMLQSKYKQYSIIDILKERAGSKVYDSHSDDDELYFGNQVLTIYWCFGKHGNWACEFHSVAGKNEGKGLDKNKISTFTFLWWHCAAFLVICFA